MAMNKTFDPTRHPHLAKWSERRQLGITRMICPQCGKTGYKPYLWPDRTIVAEGCGKCDHETSCGYHTKPSDLKLQEDASHSITADQLPPPPPSIHCPRGLVDKVYCMAEHATRNPLLRYWVNTFRDVKPEHKAMAELYVARFMCSLRLYDVGSLPGGYTVWWIQDDTGWIRSGKAMLYKADGHRDKETRGNFKWMHTALARLYDPTIPEDAEYVGCLFGLHLLLPETKEVCLVESEKTAVLMKAFRPDMTWMATMGLGNLNSMQLAPLIERGITMRLFPDLDGYPRWQQNVNEILRDNPHAKIYIDTYVITHALPGSHEDILDIMERQWKQQYTPCQNSNPHT